MDVREEREGAAFIPRRRQTLKRHLSWRDGMGGGGGDTETKRQRRNEIRETASTERKTQINERGKRNEVLRDISESLHRRVTQEGEK